MSRFCVIAGTKISLNDGTTLPIEKVKAGQEIISFNLNTLQKSQNNEILLKLSTDTFDGVIQKDLVKNIWKNTVEEYYSINDKLKITGEHIVLAKRDKTFYWTTVDKLLIGDYLFTEQNIFEKIDMIILIKEKVKVYNLQVNDVYNYFANSYLIHNGTPCSACGPCGSQGRVTLLQPVHYGGAGFPYISSGWYNTTPMLQNAYTGLTNSGVAAKITTSATPQPVQGSGLMVYITSTDWYPAQHQHPNNIPAMSFGPTNWPCGNEWYLPNCNYVSSPAMGACNPPSLLTRTGAYETLYTQNLSSSSPSRGTGYKPGDLVTVDIPGAAPAPACPGNCFGYNLVPALLRQYVPSITAPNTCQQNNFNIVESYQGHPWHAKHIVLKVLSVS